MAAFPYWAHRGNISMSFIVFLCVSGLLSWLLYMHYPQDILLLSVLYSI